MYANDVKISCLFDSIAEVSILQLDLNEIAFSCLTNAMLLDWKKYKKSFFSWHDLLPINNYVDDYIFGNLLLVKI